VHVETLAVLDRKNGEELETTLLSQPALDFETLTADARVAKDAGARILFEEGDGLARFRLESVACARLVARYQVRSGSGQRLEANGTAGEASELAASRRSAGLGRCLGAGLRYAEEREQRCRDDPYRRPHDGCQPSTHEEQPG